MADFCTSSALFLAITLFNYAFAASTSTSASSCATILTPTSSIQPMVASGYQMALVATGLTSPRSMEFDSSGNLLVVEQQKGITSFTLEDNGGPCILVTNRVDLITNNTVSFCFHFHFHFSLSTSRRTTCRTESFHDSLIMGLHYHKMARLFMLLLPMLPTLGPMIQ